jgi:hypothetical protein
LTPLAAARVSQCTRVNRSKGLRDWYRVFREAAKRRITVASNATDMMPVVNGAFTAVAM